MSSRKILTVVGATGNQGGSLIAAALQDGTYVIRGLTRNVNSAAAKALAAKGVEMVSADLNSESSLIAAFHGSSAIYAVTDFFEPFASSGPEAAIRVEAAQGINMARAASQTASLEHYIWSTLPNPMKISGGKYRVPHFEAKNKVDDYIKADKKLLAKTTFLWVTFYASNYLYPMFTPNFMVSAFSVIVQMRVGQDTNTKHRNHPGNTSSSHSPPPPLPWRQLATLVRTSVPLPSPS